LRKKNRTRRILMKARTNLKMRVMRIHQIRKHKMSIKRGKIPERAQLSKKQSSVSVTMEVLFCVRVSSPRVISVVQSGHERLILFLASHS